MKPVQFTEAAAADLEAAFDYYSEVAPHVIERFVQSLAQAQKHIESFPKTGSRRYAHLTGIEGLRHWTLKTFPYSLMYIEHAMHILVIRALHTSSDFLAHLETEHQG